ncbi:helix-turn-helix domain-containing protein, partial [Burkholderia contaminans]
MVYSRLMRLDPDTCYDALLSRNRRFDGWFFVGVATTGVYCRPVCPVKPPKAQNCSYYPSAAAAEKAGFRPCMRCRPELAPGHGLLDLSGTLADAAATLIEDGFLNTHSVDALAQRVGVTERHLRRIFGAQFGVSPVEFAQTHRLLMAKRLL